MNLLTSSPAILEVFQFVMFMFKSIITVILLHELGHILMIILFNIVYRRGIFNFKLKLTLTSVEVINNTFPNPWANILIACFGTINPLIFSFVFYSIYSNNFWGVTMFLSILSIYNIFPFAPDGNIINYNLKKLEEVRRSK